MNTHIKRKQKKIPDIGIFVQINTALSDEKKDSTLEERDAIFPEAAIIKLINNSGFNSAGESYSIWLKNELHDEIEDHDAIDNAETLEYMDLLLTALKKKMKSIPIVPTEAQIEQQKTQYETSINALEKCKKELTTNDKKQINNKDKLRTIEKKLKPIPEEINTIKHRKLAIEIEILLEGYEQERNERLSLKLKDKLTSADKKERHEFIMTLKQLSSPDLDEPTIHYSIEKNINRFPGVHLQTTLHKITLKLLEKNLREDYFTDGDRNSAARTILNSQHKIVEAQPYVLNINTLYQAIETMGAYGDNKLSDSSEKDTVRNLTFALRNDLDNFVTNSYDQKKPQKLPSKAAFNTFKAIFLARLHSEDDVMSEKVKWGSFTLNLFLGIISLGAILGIKAAVTKQAAVTKKDGTTERPGHEFTLFARETGKQRRIKAIAKEMDKIEELLSQKPKNK